MKIYLLLLITLRMVTVTGTLPLSAYERADHNKYIVLLKPGHTLEKHSDFVGRNLEEEPGFLRRFDFINGYYAILNPLVVHDLIRNDPGVEAVQLDSEMRLVEAVRSNQSLSQPSTSVPNDSQYAKRWDKRVRYNFYWHMVQMQLAEKKEKPLPRLGRYEYFFGGGDGVVIYIFDTGIQLGHADFVGQATHFQDRAELLKSPYVDEDMRDHNGHGTHVAGSTAWIAPGARFVNVKLFNEKGQADTSLVGKLIQALEDVVAEHEMYKRTRPSWWRGSVINMSFSAGGLQPALEKAFKAAYDAGIPMAAAAGNQNTVARAAPCIYSQYVICVAACTQQYTKWTDPNPKYGSNYGPAVRIIAPGEHIMAAKVNYNQAQPSDHTEMIGTSMASPLVAAVMALFVGWEHIVSDTAKVYERLAANSLSDLIDGFPSQPGTLNRLVDTGINNPSRGNGPYIGAPDHKFGDDEDEWGLRRTITDTDQVIPTVLPDVNVNDLEGQVGVFPATISADTTSTSAPVQTPSLIPAPSPAQAVLTCKGVENDKWVALDIVTNNCDGNDPKNPMDWKHGGKLVFGAFTFHVDPVSSRYTAGRCGLHATEYESWSGIDGPGTSRTWHFGVVVIAKDANGNQIGGSQAQVPCGDGNPYKLADLYYDTLSVTPEGRGDYVQFSLGSGQAWKSSDPQCSVGPSTSPYSPTHRDIDCTFNC
ncbi:peptidase S8/S53 domain-containing protein [Halenospora varia]|nr:peptidase S8/S53 domain-containing protein [Halenospora varia]